MKQSELVFDPSRWHACSESDWPACNKAANCYSYVLNNPKYYWSQPGMGFVKSVPQPYYDSFNEYFKDYSLKEFKDFMINGAVSDGLIRVEEPIDKEGNYLVALFFKDHPSNFDLHWYRKDDDGTWSHKDGWHPISNKDTNNNVIYDPRDTVNPNYPIFGSFFLVPRAGIDLTKRFPMLQK